MQLQCTLDKATILEAFEDVKLLTDNSAKLKQDLEFIRENIGMRPTLTSVFLL